MKIRVAVATALVGGLFLSLSGAQAAPPVMDGKKVKVLSKSIAGGTAQNPTDVSGFDAGLCGDQAHCPTLDFVYAPAKGAKGGLLFTASWANPLSDFDLYVVEYDKRGNGTDVGHCASFGNTVERVYLGPTSLKKGYRYALMVNLFRSLNDTVSAKVEMGVPNSVPTTVPEAVDADANLNCAL